MTLSLEKMSEAQSTAAGEERTASELTAFQQNILTVLAEEPQYGLAIKRELEDYYDSEINHGRLYPNLDDLVQRGFVAKSELDKRTNQYKLTDEGYALLLGELNWRFSKLITDDDRASDIEALVE
ncbi:transcriptional regulator PadR-like family protein [Halalkalicoccus paucihalophilus]|uniref:Transcriptional regulator PadR-like family protein n=2 Tax=Halalkalicoccus paucihalophilus TaxID=1008153 RepID=A0A151A998_9EURY|nr:transcriptional regulator PadR-like family protein [Halalkalicoccus paucihalophilus]